MEEIFLTVFTYIVLISQFVSGVLGNVVFWLAESGAAFGGFNFLLLVFMMRRLTAVEAKLETITATTENQNR